MQGAVNNVVIDVGKLLDGEFPIVSMDDGSISVDGMLFGFEITGTIIFGIVRVDANGELINEDRVLLVENLCPVTEPTSDESTADPDEDETFFFGGLEAGIQLAGKSGSTSRSASPSSARSRCSSPSGLPVILEPISGLAINELPRRDQLRQSDRPRSPIPRSWLNRGVRAAGRAHRPAMGIPVEAPGGQPGGQRRHLGGFDNVFANPETIRITAGASLSSAYATDAAFEAVVDITADLSGKFIFNAAGKFANEHDRPELPRLPGPVASRSGGRHHPVSDQRPPDRLAVDQSAHGLRRTRVPLF